MKRIIIDALDGGYSVRVEPSGVRKSRISIGEVIEEIRRALEKDLRK